MNDAVERYIADTLDKHESRLKVLENKKEYPRYYLPSTGNLSFNTWLIVAKGRAQEEAQRVYMAENRVAWLKYQAELKKIEEYK